MNTHPLQVPALPEQSGAYRWLYADARCGEYTAVAIFMVGSVFSARYSGGLERGASPRSHCAVNFALYRRGEKVAWVLSEYGGAEQSPRRLGIGRSSWRYLEDGRLDITVDERRAPWGAPVRARLLLTPQSPPLEEQVLLPGSTHRWQLCMGRAHAELHLPEEGVFEQVGTGYHDTNHGAVRLGDDLPGWSWTRVHGPHSSKVSYRVPGQPTLQVQSWQGGVTAFREEEAPQDTQRTGWGLRVPTGFSALLESSPFYARLESDGDGQGHVLGEVADFRRFHSPLVRWMAHFRTRVEREAAEEAA